MNALNEVFEKFFLERTSNNTRLRDCTEFEFPPRERARYKDIPFFCKSLVANHEGKIYMLYSDFRDIYLQLDGTRNGNLVMNDNFEFCYVAKGHYRRVIDGTEIKLNEGDFYFSNMTSFYYDILETTDSHVIFFNMSRSFANDLLLHLSSSPYIKTHIHAVLSGNSSARFIFAERKTHNFPSEISRVLSLLFTASCNGLHVGSERIIQGMLIWLFDTIEKEYSFKSVAITNEKYLRSYAEIDRYLRDNIMTVTRQALSEKFHFNIHYFNVLLKRMSGYSFKQYLQKIRIETAIKLLSDTDMTIRDISKSIGYENTNYFYQLFIKATGESPSGYRKSHRKNQALLG